MERRKKGRRIGGTLERLPSFFQDKKKKEKKKFYYISLAIFLPQTLALVLISQARKYFLSH
jgi:CRISPR/Cas system CMR-associated protein Cmr3 (group 5 of RAMP superfamily)